MFILWASTKIVQAAMIRLNENIAAKRQGLIFLYYLYRKPLKASCQKLPDWFQNIYKKKSI